MSLTDLAIAHRGGMALGPENTLTAFAASHALGLRALETDAQVTADGIAIAFHDSTLTSLTGLPGKVGDYTWRQLRTVRVEGEPLLRLDDLLSAFPDTAFLVDIKNAACIAPVSETLRATRSSDRVCVAGGMDPWLHAVAARTGCQRAMGFRALTALMGAAKLGLRAPSAIFSGVTAAHIPTRLLGFAWMACPRASARLVESVHDQGLLLRAWTVNVTEEMERFLELGVDAIITDHPDVLRTVMIRRGLWTKPEKTTLWAHAGALQTGPLQTSSRSRTAASGRATTVTTSSLINA